MADVLVDTSVWSLALRRRRSALNDRQRELVEELKHLVEEDNAVLIDVIRFELLAGLTDATRFEEMRQHLQGFRVLSMAPETFDRAAAAYNRCLTNGIAATAIDMLICASAMEHDVAILTTDGDFEHYARQLPIHLYRV